MSIYWKQANTLKLADKELETIIANLKLNVDFETINSLTELRKNLKKIHYLLEDTDITLNRTINAFQELKNS